MIIEKLNPHDSRTCQYCGSEMRPVSSIIWWCLGCGTLHVPSDIYGLSGGDEWKRPRNEQPRENQPQSTKQPQSREKASTE